MFDGHDPYLVALSVLIAIMGGYTGFGFAARLREAEVVSHRLLLASAAAFLAVGIWTMHFVGMLAAPLPADAIYLVVPTVASFLICSLVVGISLFFVSIDKPSLLRVVSSAVLLGLGIVSMHYVGMFGLAGNFGMTHDAPIVAAAILIAIGAAYGGLRIFLARQGGLPLLLSAIAFGVAVSGMHYTAMWGMHIVPAGGAHQHQVGGLVASPQILSLVVTLVCFVVAAGFLLSLVPDRRRNDVAPATAAAAPDPVAPTEVAGAVTLHARKAAPLGGLGQPRSQPVSRLPVEGANGTLFIDTSDVRSIRADAHYTVVHDGTRERMCPWSISEVDAQLDPVAFVRVHRSHIVAVRHIILIRKAGDGAVIEVDGQAPHQVPVSRAKVAEVKARLGLAKRSARAS
jgi:NO-binding membrane sensor protein with MHYT domain